MNELVRAARLALHAPSVSTPSRGAGWSAPAPWSCTPTATGTWASWTPDDRLITRSCGAALCPPGRYPHHPGWAAHPLDFNGTYSGSNPRPPSFTLNGATCST